MSIKYKTSFRIYPAWDYQSEINDLNRASENGWHLVKGGCLHCKFVKNQDIRYRYQIDFRKIDDMGRYIETFREQGWEYVNSTFNGWHYFRKFYDPSLPEASYEIFTDKQSLNEMKKRWGRLVFIIAAVIGIMALICLVRMILKPQLPALVQFLTAAIESVPLFYGVHAIRKREPNPDHRGSRALFAAFLFVIVIGCTAGIVLTEMRPYLSSQQMSEEVTEVIKDNRWIGFDVKYPDNYYLDLDMKSDAPFTFEIINGNGEIMYSENGTDVHKENVCIWLPKGQYCFSMTAEDGFELSVSIE